MIRPASRVARLGAAIALATLLLPATALAQDFSAVSAAEAAGTVGERYDGFLGVAGAVPDGVRRQVNTLNIRRRTLYYGLASRRGVTIQEVELSAGCSLIARTPIGGAYLLSDNSWHRRGPGQSTPRPNYCH